MLCVMSNKARRTLKNCIKRHNTQYGTDAQVSRRGQPGGMCLCCHGAAHSRVIRMRQSTRPNADAERTAQAIEQRRRVEAWALSTLYSPHRRSAYARAPRTVEPQRDAT